MYSSHHLLDSSSRMSGRRLLSSPGIGATGTRLVDARCPCGNDSDTHSQVVPACVADPVLDLCPKGQPRTCRFGVSGVPPLWPLHMRTTLGSCRCRHDLVSPASIGCPGADLLADFVSLLSPLLRPFSRFPPRSGTAECTGLLPRHTSATIPLHAWYESVQQVCLEAL